MVRPAKSNAAKQPADRRAQPPHDRFSGTRAAHRDETAEDYAEAIDQLIAEHGEARVKDLAEMMGVSHVTVSRIVSRLASAGLLRAARRRPIELTEKGREVAARSRRRHETVLVFLRAIGVNERQAMIDAEGIEHHVSEETIRAMERVADGRPSPLATNRRLVPDR